jgi:sugar lactone lactonase YvrE
LAIDPDAKRLFVGGSSSGVIYSLGIGGKHRQEIIANGLGSVNPISIDRKRNKFYVSDSSRRRIWAGPLAGRMY